MWNLKKKKKKLQMNLFTKQKLTNIENKLDFPGGTVVKNPSANAGNMGLSPGPGRSLMPRSN